MSRIYVGTLDRVAIMKLYARHVPCDLAHIDGASLARSTPGCCGADLRALVNEAALLAVHDRSSLSVEQRHLDCAVLQLQESLQNLRNPSPRHLHG
jgi:ATP-dependent Zn protease